MDVQDYFSKVEDPRVVGRCKHKLSDVLVIALASYLCGGEDYELMHELCLERGNSLRPLVELPNGCPSVDTFERVLQRIEPQSLYACLQIYGKELISDLEGKHIAIDGKRLKGSQKKTGSTHITYDQIKHYKKPAIRLCGSGGQLHWTLAYGAKTDWFLALEKLLFPSDR